MAASTFYKNTNDVWVVDDKRPPAGSLTMIPNPTQEKIELRYANSTGVFLRSILVTDIAKNVGGDKYANYAELEVATADFFVNATGATPTAVRREYGKTQIIEIAVTAAANVGVTTIATVTDHPCLIKSVVLYADTAQTGDLTSAAIEGGVGQVVEFISAVNAVQTNLDAADKQVSFDGAVRLAAGKLITIDLQGTGATAVDLTVSIEYEASVDGSYLI